MPQIKILSEISAPSSAIKTRVEEAFASAYHRLEDVPDPNNTGSTIPNPESKADFMRNVILNFIREVTQSYEGEKAGDVAREKAKQKARDEIVPI